MRHRSQLTKQEIRHSGSRRNAVESEGNGRKYIRLLAVLVFETGVTEGELMRTANDAEIFGYREIGGYERSLNRCADSDIRTAAHREHRLMRHVTIDLHANVASGKVIIVEPCDRNTIERYTKSVNGVRVDEIRVADRSGLSEIIQSAGR